MTIRRVALLFIAILLAIPAGAAQSKLQHATFAGGCFWCMVHPFDELPGVVKVVSGYTGGRTVNPTYEDVSGGETGHREAVDIVFDPARISYSRLLEVFWHNVDPTNNYGQFCDVGLPYRSAIFVHDAEQRRAAEVSKAALEKRMKVYTDVLPAAAFYQAEAYHQDYYRKNPVRYRFYRLNCGRDGRLEKIWGAAAGH